MFVIAFLLFSKAIHCEEEILYGTFTKATGNFANNDYMNSHQISVSDFTYSSSDSLEGQPISNAFEDKSSNTYWVSKDSINEASKTYILINFHDQISLEGFVIGLAYRTSSQTRTFDGSPLELNVYTSKNNEPLKLKYFFNGTYNTKKSEDWTQIQFVFTNPIECDTLKVEFLNVTYDGSFSNNYNSVIKYLLLVEYIDESTNIAIEGVTGDYSDEYYVKEHKIPFSYFTTKSSGDKTDYPNSNLFDDDINTYWVSREPNKDFFKNYLIFDFQGSISLQGFLYDPAYRTRGSTRYFDGFPTKLKVYSSINNEPFRFIYQFTGQPVFPWTQIQFIFPKFVDCDRIKLEFITVTNDVSFGNELTACCAGLTLIQHINDEYLKVIDEINSIFTDYSQLILNKDITPAKIEELKQKAIHHPNYESDLKLILDRADAVNKGTVKKDPHREFSTKPDSRNKIEQYGDSAGYCHNQMLLNNFGTNRQVIGIGGNTGKPIIVYVDVEPIEGQPKSSVKLPIITFTQILGSWQSSFRTSTIKLGRNELIFPDIQSQGYTVPVIKGGPIHINNPYTYEEQGGHVSIYIEGGYIYPVFHRGDDESSFKIILQNYYNRLNDPNDTDITVDAFEAVSDHVITTCSCTLAYTVYINEGFSPKENIDRWDDFLEKLLLFGGIPFDKNNPMYNPMNDHVRENFRTVQPFAGFFAFACTEMIGLPSSGTHRHCVYLTIPGWAFAHEFGHTVDKKGRIWAENTNNMWAMYNIFMMNGEIYDRIPITSVSQNLGPDLSDYVTHKDGLYQMGSNPTIWWILEGAKPGYWAESENSFIYEKSDRDENGNSIIGMTERLIYYATLSFGHNMSTYFERWGFYMKQDRIYNEDNKWTYQNSTDNFKNLMNQAKEANKFDEEVKKYWYINLDQYQYLFDHENKLTEKEHCYNSDEYITPNSIIKNGNSYIIFLPEFKCHDTHLCYEIQSFINDKWIVLGNTYTQVFADNYDYKGAKPKYRVYAYDRLLDHTGDPPNFIEPSDNQEATCRIGETNYNTLNEAINACQNGDTIILLRSFMLQQLQIDKKVTIVPDENLEEPITITKINPGYLIAISNLGTGQPNIQIGNISRVKIIFDGGGFKQNGPLIQIGGTKKLLLYNVELKNNANSENGGAIYINHNAHVEMINCLVEKCSSDKSGGAIYLCGGQQNYVHSELHVNNVTFKGNSASQNGGAIDASGTYGYSKLVSNSGAIFENNIAGGNGGAIRAVKYQQMIGSVFKGNQAKNGGAIYIECSSFEFKICTSNFSNNIASNKGSDIYLQTGNLLLNGGKYEGIIYKINGSIIKLNKWSSNEATLPDATFSLDLPNGGNSLIDVIDNSFTDLISDSIDTFKIQNGFAKYEENKIIAYPSQSTLTITFNEQRYTLIISYGDFILPSTFEGFPEDYCITQWIKDSVTYNVGDKIFINQDCSFNINAIKYNKIKIVYNGKEQILKIIPNTYYYMPMTTPDDEIVFGWECSDGNYYAYADPVLITTDLTFTAVLIKKVTVTLQIGNDIEKFEINYNEYFTLPTPPDTLNGLNFKYFFSEGDYKYKPGESISIIKDIKFTAFYSNEISIIFVAGENEQTLEFQFNEEITLHIPGPENPNKPNIGREFIYWTIEDTKYYPFTKYKILTNVHSVASYGLINKSEPITITYEVPNVSSEYPHYVEGTKTITESHSYLENITLLDKDFFLKEPNGLGYDENTSSKILFDYWLIDGKRYEGSETFGITEPFTAVMVTKLKDGDDDDDDTSSDKPAGSSTSGEIQTIQPETQNPSLPFKTPEPHEIEEIKPNGNVIDTTNIPAESNKEYSSKVTTDSVEIIGKGSENFYISINNEKEVDIKKTDAKFGVNLNLDKKEASIKLNQPNPNMNVKGGGTLTISANDEIKNITINDVTVFQNKLNINVNQKIDSFEFNNLNMFGNAEFNSNAEQEEKPAKVKSVTVNEGATARMTNLQVTEKVNIELNAILSISKVDLTKVSEVVIAYSSSSHGKVPITGKLGAPPKNIELVEKQSSLKSSSMLDQITTFTIAAAPKDDFSQCNQWKDAVRTEGTIFKSVECKNDGGNNNNLALVASSSLLEEPKKKNTTPIIIGVVVAVVVVIVIVIVVVIVVKKKKNGYESSDSNIMETNNDDNFDI